MKNLIIKVKYLLIVLILPAIPFFKEADAQVINIPKDEVIDVPIIKINDNQPIDFSINKKKFAAGEKVEVKAIFHNQTQQPFAGRMIVTISPLDKSFPAKPFIKEFNLPAGEKTQDFVSEMNIEDWMPAGIYKAEIEIRGAKDYLIYKKFEVFEVFEKEKVNNEIKATVQMCADESCSKKRMVFGKDETVYFKLDSSVQDLRINATIKTPNGKIEVLNLENNIASYSLKNAKEGRYSLWVNLSKEDYKNRRIEKEFFLEEDYTEAEFKSICKIDSKCEGEENEHNCPQDCSPKAGNKLFTYALVIVVLIIMGIAALIVYKRKKKNNNVSSR